ncbi:MAG TPA: monovalent cation/H(+) antiporter subunit G, partial [Nakamurella sp.]
QVLGIMLLMLGVGLRLQSPAVIGVLVLIVVLQFVTAPVSAHLTVRAAYRHSVDDEAEAGESAALTEKGRAEKDRGQPGSAG